MKHMTPANTTSMLTLSAKDDTFQAYAALPPHGLRGSQTKGGIVLVHEVWGLVEHIKDVADRLAAEGYIVVAPDLLSEQDILRHADQLQVDLFNPATRNQAQPKLRELMAPLHDDSFVQQSIGRLKACFDHLMAQPDVKERVAVLGFCFGGTYAYQLAAAEPLLKAAIPFYGHAPLNDAKLGWVSCPVLAFYGGRDEGLMKQLPAVEEAMAEAAVDFEARVYEDAGHAFFNDTNSYAYNATAAEDAWQRTLEFLERNVAHAAV